MSIIEFNQVINNNFKESTTKQTKMSGPANNIRPSGLTRNQEATFRTVLGNDGVTDALLARLASPVIQPVAP